MKLGQALSKVSGILNPLNYFRGRRKEKLYEQWVQRAELPPEVIPRKKVIEDVTPKIERERLQQPILYVLLYVLLGASLVVLCMGLILLIVQSC